MTHRTDHVYVTTLPELLALGKRIATALERIAKLAEQAAEAEGLHAMKRAGDRETGAFDDGCG